MKTFYPVNSILKVFFLFIGILYAQNAKSQTPTFASFSPKSGKAGDMITIRGTNLTQIKAIYFDVKKADTLRILSDTILTASVPSSAGADIYGMDLNNNWIADTLTGFTYLSVSVPVISSFDEDKGYNGSTVNIVGGNFAEVTNVSFGGVPAAQYTVVSPNLIKAKVSTGATGAISVTNTAGTGSLAGFTYALPIPHIISFTPTTTTPGSAVTITGSYFNDVNSVTFGNVPARSFTVVNATTINAVVDNGASGSVMVFSSFGHDSVPGFTIASTAPKITSFTPDTSYNGLTVTISGNNFTGATAVSFGGVSAQSFQVVSATQITATLAGGASGLVKVQTSAGADSLGGFVYQMPRPIISSFTPKGGVTGTQITITGSNLNYLNSVSFEYVSASSFQIISPTTVVATVGSGNSGHVFVNSTYGHDSLAGFTFIQPPVINSFSPTQAKIGDTVIINGSNFSFASVVSFGGAPASSFIVGSDNLIRAVVPNNTGGSITVTNPAGSVSMSGFLVAYPPKISSFTPDSVPALVSVTIKGNHFNNVTRVTFGGVASSNYNAVSDSVITAEVPVGAQWGYVAVYTSFGVDSLAGLGYIDYAPQVFSVVPATAQEDQQVTIKGNNLETTTAVYFNSVPAKSFTVSGNTSIVAVMPRTNTGKIRVVTPYGVDSSANFTFLPPAPSVSSFSPMEGTFGTIVTVKGTNFDYAYRVLIGQKIKSPFNVVSDSVLKFSVDSPFSGQITVLSSLNAGTASANSFTFDTQKQPDVMPSGDNPVSGPLTTKVTIDSSVQTYNGLPYVQRHYDIEPTNNASTATATITLYFYQDDFDNYNNFYSQGLHLPAYPNDAVGKANLKIYQYHGFSATSVPGTYDQTGIEIDPDDNNIVWNSTTNLWEVTFNVTGFSGFFIGTNSAILPLKLLSFDATPANDAAMLRWTTSNEINVDRFEIQRSDDGKQFATRGSVNANGSETNKTSYSFIDNIATSGSFYYRLKMIDIDGKFGYSKVVKVTAFANSAGLLLYPNPASNFITVSHPFIKNNITVRLVDVNGKVIKQLAVTKGTKETTIDVSGLKSGTYTLIWNDGEQTFNKMFLIQ